MLSHSRQACLTLCDPMNCSLAPLSMGFSWQQYWSGLPCPPPEDLPNPGSNPRLSLTGCLPLMPPGKPNFILREAYFILFYLLKFNCLTFFLFYLFKYG